MKEKSHAEILGLGAIYLLGILVGITLVCLKVSNQIDLDWFFVTLPFWLPLAVFVVMAVIIACIITVVILSQVNKDNE